MRQAIEQTVRSPAQTEQAGSTCCLERLRRQRVVILADAVRRSGDHTANEDYVWSVAQCLRGSFEQGILACPARANDRDEHAFRQHAPPPARPSKPGVADRWWPGYAPD